MNIPRLVLCLAFTAAAVLVAVAQRFPCDGQLLVSTVEGSTTTISRPRSIPFSPPFFSPYARYNGLRLDALGFNATDHYIYGIRQGTNEVVRLRKDNVAETVGTMPGVSQIYANAGDCSPDGTYIVHDYLLNQLLAFQVVDGFALLWTIDLYWEPSSGVSGPFTTRLFDIAIDPDDPTVAYAHQGTADDPALLPSETRGSLLRINVDLDSPTAGMVTPATALGAGAASHYGGLLFSSTGDLYGFGGNGAGLIPPQQLLYTINVDNGQAGGFLSVSPSVDLSDGCSCPYSLSFSNSVPTEGMYCNNEEKTFTLTISNYSFNTFSDVVLRDTLPDGMVIQEVSDSHIGTMQPGTGIGTNILVIPDLVIPAKTVIEIDIKVLSVDAEVGPTYNQAWLENLPERFGEAFPSDDLGTSGVSDDSSCFFVTARELEEVRWEVTSPSDCLAADDGRVKLISPQFFPGQEFEVRLRNKVGWEEQTIRYIVDQDNSITVDSLVPGDYQVFHVRSTSDNCSLAIKDTTIVVDPPNGVIDLTISDNGPVCEGGEIRLNSVMSPSGTVLWTGPKSLGSDAANTIIADAEVERSGEYRIVASYGFCEVEKTFTLEVKPQVQVEITGDSVYCARDSMQLLAVGSANSLQYLWTGPEDWVQRKSLGVIPSLTTSQTGQYQIVATNGACYDTATTEVLVQPSPTLSLQQVIMTDFCDPVLLQPEVSEGMDVSYSWLPNIGLSCSDCPTPTVVPTVQPWYKAIVENTFGCRDSAVTVIQLDKRDLVHNGNIFSRTSTTGNSSFVVTPGCAADYIADLYIYDRWGGVVYTYSRDSDGPATIQWDGTYGGRSCGSGVYLWYANVILVDGSERLVAGDVTLIGD